MSAETWIKFYPSDWLHGTSILTAEERGVYITLIMLMYDRGGPLPHNEKLLARQCNMQVRRFRSVLETLVEQEKVSLSNDQIFNEKVGKLLQEYFSRSEKASKGGIAKAEKYSNRNKETDVANAHFEQTPSKRQASHKQPPSNAKPEARNQKPEDSNDTPHNYSNPSAAQQAHAAPRQDTSENGLLEERLRLAAGWFHAEPKLAQVGPIAELIAQGASLEIDVIPTVKARAADCGSKKSWAYFVGPIRDALAARTAAGKPAEVPTSIASPATTSTAPTRIRVPVKVDTDQWEAWRKHRLASGQRPPNPMDLRDAEGKLIGRGWWFDAEWPPPASTAAA